MLSVQNRSSHKILGVALAAVVALIAVTTQAQDKNMHRGVFELTSDNTDQWEATLNNVDDMRTAFGKDHTELEVVAHGKGLGILRNTNQALKERITSISASGVRFAACENTMRKQHVTKQDLLPAASTVDSGVAEVVRKQEAGWAYLKSGS